MPLNTFIERDGEPLQLRWGGFHMCAMVFAASWDSGEGIFEDNTEPEMEEPEYANKEGHGPLGHYIHPSYSMMISYPHIGMTPLNNGPYILKKDYRFVDAQDGEILDLKAGDKLIAYRSHK